MFVPKAPKLLVPAGHAWFELVEGKAAVLALAMKHGFVSHRSASDLNCVRLHLLCVLVDH